MAKQATILGVAELKKNLRRFGEEGEKRGERALKETSMLLGKFAQQNLINGKQKATGGLVNSMRIDREQTQELYYIISFQKDYGIFVEFGRRAGGRMPPVNPIFEWVKKKGIADTKTKSGRRKKRDTTFEQRAKSIAFAIARSIGMKGIPARPFLFPALEKVRRENILITKLTRAIRDLINDSNRTT